jgi:sugar-specific transcriptional regulator TrmB
LSTYSLTAYLALVKNHPVNGSQLSKHSGIPRARIYDVLRTLKSKGFVAELSEGTYLPLPPDEFMKRLRNGYEADLTALENHLREAEKKSSYDFVWTIRGYKKVMSKAREMIRAARSEIYVRLFPEEGARLDDELRAAESRGVQVKYILMSPSDAAFELQVLHPDHESLEALLGGRSLDIVVDKEEFLGGMFVAGKEEHCTVNWGKNRWFVLAGRDSLRHDFFHYFLHKTYEKQEPLTEGEVGLYALIMKDA